MKHPTLESDDNNSTLDPCDTKLANNSVHNENETATEGKPLVRKKYNRTIEDDETATAAQLDQDVLLEPRDQEEPEHDARALSLTVKPAIARQQVKDRLQEAMKEFVFVEVEPSKNKEEEFDESWHIRDQITRGHLGKEEKTKARLLSTLHRLHSDCYLTTLDPLGVSIHAPGKESSADFAMQKDNHGNVVYENGQTLDRRKAKSKRDDGVIETRNYGSARTAKRSTVVHEFNVHRDEPLSFSITDATNNIEEIRAGLGPLWAILEPVIFNNMKSVEVGYGFGK